MSLTATAALTSGLSGLCLKFVRLSLGAPSRAATALQAWNAAEHKHAGDRDTPAGVPLFFTAGRSGAGHVALGLGSDRVRSTDWPHTGLIADTTIGAIEHAWGRTYLGWTEDLNGVSVYTPSAAPTPPDPQPLLTLTEDDMTPIFIACKDHRMIIVSSAGVGRLTAEAWQVWTNLGYKTTKLGGQDALDVGPFDIVIASLGGFRY